MGENIPVMLTWTPRAHKTRQRTTVMIWHKLSHLRQGTKEEVQHRDGWEEVNCNANEFFNASSMSGQDNGKPEERGWHLWVGLSSGLHWELRRNIGGRERTREKAPQCRCSGDGQLPLETQTTVCFPSCMEQKPSISVWGWAQYIPAPRAWHRCTSLQEGQKQGPCP